MFEGIRKAAPGLVLVMLGLLAQMTGAVAQPFPSRAITIVVPFAPGTGLDVIGRGLAGRLSEQMGVNVVVENKEGAGSIIGSNYVRTSPPDGYRVLFVGSPPFAVNTLLQKEPAYDPTRDFTVIGKFAVVPMVLVSSNSAPFKTFDEFVQYAKAHPGELRYASSGVGAASHLTMESLMQPQRLVIPDVPYKNTGQANTDVVAGHIPLYVPSFPAALPFLQAGQYRALALGAKRRSPQMPDLPTMAEVMKQPDFDALVWYGVFGPAGIEQPVVNRLYDEFAKAMETPQMKELLVKFGTEVELAKGDEFLKQIKREREEGKRLLESLKLLPVN